MAANNKDSKRIFDLYVNQYLLEAEEGPARSKESSEPAKSTESKADNGSNFTAVGDNSAAGANFTAQGDPSAQQQSQAFGQAAADRAVDKYAGAAPQKTWTQQNMNTGYSPVATPQAAPAQQAKPTNMSDADFQKMLDQQYADFKKTGQAPAAQQSTTPAASTPPSKEDIQRYGQTGAELRQSSGGQFMTRADRTDQAKVDSILGQGKYKAGTEEANLALADYFKKTPSTVTPGRPGTPTGSATATTAAPAASTPAPSAPATSTAATGVNVPSWRNQPGMNQGQGPTQVNAIKQAAQSAGLTLSDDQLSKFSKALGIG